MGLMDDVLKAGVGALAKKVNQDRQFNFEKAKMTLEISDDEYKGSPVCLEFQYNPPKIQIRKKVNLNATAVPGSTTPTPKPDAATAWEISIPDVIFDTYSIPDGPKSVYDEYVCKLEQFITVIKDGHRIPKLKFTYGSKFKTEYTVFMEGLDVTYEMFLPDGTPVRARTSIKLTSTEPKLPDQDADGHEAGNSPDHARLYTVRRGDTLPLISEYAYDTPSEWRRIADFNHLDDPLGLKPGMRLLLPPIHK